MMKENITLEPNVKQMEDKNPKEFERESTEL